MTLRFRAAARAITLIALGMALAACADNAVSVTPPQPTGAAAAACTALDPVLPSTVDGSAASPVNPESPYTAAWGDIVLSCGADAPSIPSDAQLFTIEGVDWYPQTLTQGAVRFTTVKRVASVSVLVPATRSPAANALVDLGPAITRTVPVSAGAR